MFIYQDTAIKTSRGLSLLVVPVVLALIWFGYFLPLVIIVGSLALTWYIGDMIHNKFMMKWINKIRYRYFNG